MLAFKSFQNMSPICFPNFISKVTNSVIYGTTYTFYKYASCFKKNFFYVCGFADALLSEVFFPQNLYSNPNYHSRHNSGEISSVTLFSIYLGTILPF